MLKVTLFVFFSLAFTSAEPPVPSNHYHANSFSASSSIYGSPSALALNAVQEPSSSYDASVLGQTEAFIIPSMQHDTSNVGIQYGTPRVSSQYGVPGIGTGTSKINPQYGVPRIGSRNSAPQISSLYGVPNFGHNYLPPNTNGYARDAYNDQSDPANYNFQYEVQDAENGNIFGHEEARHEDQAQGKYSVVLPDGRRQTVEYTADVEGYKPKISYEQTNNGYGYTRGDYSNGGYSNGGHANGIQNNGGYTNSGLTNGQYTGRYSNGGYQY